MCIYVCNVFAHLDIKVCLLIYVYNCLSFYECIYKGQSTVITVHLFCNVYQKEIT